MTVKQSGSFMHMTVQTLKAMLHEAIFLATCNATNVALRLQEKIHA